jgi:hypothetical protein
MSGVATPHVDGRGDEAMSPLQRATQAALAAGDFSPPPAASANTGARAAGDGETAVAAAIDGAAIVVEAGTGVGKTYAYLVSGR